MLANTPERSGLELLGDAHNGPEGLAPLRFTSAGGYIHARDSNDARTCYLASAVAMRQLRGGTE